MKEQVKNEPQRRRDAKNGQKRYENGISSRRTPTVRLFPFIYCLCVFAVFLDLSYLPDFPFFPLRPAWSLDSRILIPGRITGYTAKSGLFFGIGRFARDGIIDLVATTGESF